jgi:alkylated DNA repair protein alkB homolog 7
MLYLNLRHRLLHTTRQFSTLIDFSAPDASLSKLAVQVVPDAVTQAQHDALCAELEPVFKRKRYEKGHWDAVIEDYKESERLDDSWNAVNRATVEQVCALELVFNFSVNDAAFLAVLCVCSISRTSDLISVCCCCYIPQIRQHAAMPAITGAWLPVHAIDLTAAGHIRPHVDSIKFSGTVVAGISLLSTAIMKLQHPEQPHSVVKLLLPPRYI